MKDTIVYIGSFFLPDKSAGAHRALSLSKSFRDLGYEVVLVGMSEREGKEDVLQTKDECFGFSTYSVKKPMTVADWVHHSISIKEFTSVIDFVGKDKVLAIVAMEYEAIPLLRLSRYCHRNNIALIADAEEWYEKSNLSFPISLGKDIDTWLRMNYVYKYKINNMICISRFFESFYSTRIKNRAFIPGTVDIKEEKWNQLPPYIPNEIFTIGYAGHPGINFEKERFDWIINAIQRLNKEGLKCRLVYAGFNNDFLLKKGLCIDNDTFICVGKVPHKKCLDIITTCDCSIIAREDKRVTKAGFPTKLSESLGCGTPVITTQSSNVAEFIHEGINGFLSDSFDEDGIYSALKKIVTMDKQSLVLMHKATKTAFDLYYERFNEDLKKHMDNLIV